MSIYCTNCGAVLFVEANFCWKCGVPVAPESQEELINFMAAIKAGNVEKVKALLEQDPSLVRVRNPIERNQTPLHRAVFDGNEAIVKLLLDHEAEVDARDIWGYTPLHLSAHRADSEKIVLLLLQYGADPNARNTLHGTTPLLEAAYAGRAKVVELLCSRGADLNVTDNMDISPLQAASLGKHQRHLETMDVLRSCGAQE